MDPVVDVAVWANRGLASEHWHRVALVSDYTVMTTCQRVFVAPMDLRSDVPMSGFSCRECVAGVPVSH